ncbi:class I SAM-dependent methyltransferase [Tenacibaculum haliotis]|uniref:class I SAM-dependent methyltransferase n=1 Tax=Tenacibaculum haliotis TaxID=1888914 RepID=UPI0021AFE176|nr:methyltransferase [Tenacibaculum haliotis]MCT4697598.1 methyltransferase [Tenacibaculum haliotis]
METKLEFNSTEYQLERYPKTDDKSLRAWSNAELLILDYISDKKIANIHLYNDRFGVFNTVLNDKNLTTVWTYASQQKAINQNLKLNNLVSDSVYKTPLDDLDKVSFALLKVPKSLELFELFLQQIHKASEEQTIVVCGFMTKYFSVSFLKVAEQYFDEVIQSKAWKKARLLILKKPKKIVKYRELINEIQWKKDLCQFYGVFSAGKVDIGTQFLLENLKVQPNELKVLDVASGNGIIACEVVLQNSNTEVTLVDDFNLAIASSQLNLKGGKAQFICGDNLEGLAKESYDLVVSNPPFHFEHENNIEVALSLFKGVKNCLKPNGRFVLVANRHLNYKTHLEILFKEVIIVAENKKFVVYECVA